HDHHHPGQPGRLLAGRPPARYRPDPAPAADPAQGLAGRAQDSPGEALTVTQCGWGTTRVAPHIASSRLDEVTHPQPAVLETVQFDGLDTATAVAQRVAMMAGGFLAVDDGFLYLHAETRLLVFPHAFQDLPGVGRQGTADVLDAQAGGRHPAVMLEEPLLVTVVPAFDLTMQEMLDGFLRTH